MSCETQQLLTCCLFFTANALARTITRMGEEEFARIGLAPSHAFLLSLTIEQPGIPQKDLAEQLHLAPSTVSRFVDTLAKRELIFKEGQGRSTLISATPKGEALKPGIQKAWKRLYERYSQKLGQEQGNELTRLTAEAYAKLEHMG